MDTHKGLNTIVANNNTAGGSSLPASRVETVVAGSNDEASTLSVSQPPGTCTLFIGNLPFTTDAPALRELLHDFHIKTITIARTAQGNSKGYGFVEFTNEQELENFLRTVKSVFCEDRKLVFSTAVKAKQTTDT
ncbi:hypothetical protein Pelo_1025 [Pelomyxa schiedti]|nr:hypothetical protein Pelo_1025 [Pelomyxa schiedti]